MRDSPRRARGVLLVVSLATGLSALSSASINLALPEMGGDLGLDIGSTGWIVTSYLVAATVFLLVAGRIGDLVGHRAVYLAGFALFGAASAVCAAAPGFPALLAGRVLQGLGGAMAMATGPALLTTSFAARHRGRALGTLSTAIYAGLTAGPLLGGWILAVAGWRWIFALNVPMAAAILVLARRLLPGAGPPSRETLPRPPFDLGGAAALAAGLPLLLFALSRGHDLGWGSPSVVAGFAAGAALLAAFVGIEARVPHPLLDLSLFRSRVFSGAALAAAGNYAALFIPIILLPYYLTQARSMDAARAGLLLSTQPLVMALVASPSGRLSDRIGSRGLASGGMLVLAAGIAGLAALGAETPPWVVAVLLAVVGLGTGVFISPNSSALMGAAPRSRQGVAGGVMAVSRNLGMVAGVAAATSLFAAAGGRAGTSWAEGDIHALRVAMAAAAGVALLGAGASALRGPRPPSARSTRGARPPGSGRFPEPAGG